MTLLPTHRVHVDLPLNQFYELHPDTDFRFECVEVSDGSLEKQPIWQRIKSLQRRSSPRKHRGHKLKVVLHTPNWQNTGAKPTSVYWPLDKKVNIRITRDAGAIADAENLEKFTLSETDEDEPNVAPTRIEVIDNLNKIAQHLASMEICTPNANKERSIQNTQHRTSSVFCPADYLDISDAQYSLSRLYLGKVGLLEQDIGPEVKHDLGQVLVNADIMSIVDAITNINLTIPFLRRSTSAQGAEWFWPQITLSVSPRVVVWKALTRAGAINLTRNVILALSDAMIQHSENLTDNVATTKYTPLMRTNVEKAFLNNGDWIITGFESNIRQSSDDDLRWDRQMISPCIDPKTIHLENGIVTICTETPTVRFTPYGATTNITRHLPYKYIVKMSDRDDIWSELFPTLEIGRFVLNLLAHGIFYLPSSDPKRNGAQYKTILVFEVPDSFTAVAMNRFFIQTFGPYLLNCAMSDDQTYHEVSKWPCSTQRIDRQSHKHYRFAMTDLSDGSFMESNAPRFDIARNLGASIPHLIIGQPGIAAKLNVASHEAPFVVSVRALSKGQAERLEQCCQVFFSQALECWQQEPNLPVKLFEQIPKSIEIERAVQTWFSERAIIFITEQVIRDEETVSLTTTGLTKAFKIYLSKGILANEIGQKSSYQDEMERYQFVARDNLLRICEASKCNTEEWKGLRVLRPGEKRPVYAHLLGSLREKYFEAMYQQHKDENPGPSSISRFSFFRWCKRNNRPTTIPDVD